MEKKDLMSGQKISSLIGMPIFALTNGKRVGTVKDIVFDSQHSRLAALTIEEPGIISSERRILPFDRVKSIGRDAIMVENEDAFVAEANAPEVVRVLEQKSAVTDKRVLTEGGNLLGYVSDIMIDPETGKAQSYELTGGMAKDIAKGRTYVGVPDIVVLGLDAMIVPDQTEIMLAKQEPGGLVAVYQEAAEEAREVGAGISEYTREQEINMSRGRTAGQDVRDDEGGLIVGKGQKITDEVIDRAVEASKMHDVAYAAGVGGAAAGYEAGRERTYEATGKQLLGKEVPRDVADDQGRVIVPGGTVVTEETLARARDAGVVGRLANTVFGDAATRGAGTFWQRAGEEWEHTREQLTEAWTSLQERSHTAADETARRRVVASQKEFLKGKVSATEITDDQGQALVSEGDILTPLMLDNLDRAGKLEQVKLMPEGRPAEMPEEEEERPETRVVVETHGEHEEHRPHM